MYVFISNFSYLSVNTNRLILLIREIVVSMSWYICLYVMNDSVYTNVFVNVCVCDVITKNTL